MESADQPLKVVICWHMHQPEYRDLDTGTYHQPWTYLHTIKDYVDMVAHLEANPQARAVVNFAPTLIEQIDDYDQQVREYLAKGITISDPLLAALVADWIVPEPEARCRLVKAALRANGERLVKRFPAYQQLAKMSKWLEKHPEDSVYYNDQYLFDLLVWYHLAWIGETVRRRDSRIRALMSKERNFTSEDRRLLLKIIGELLDGLLGRYRKLAESGQVELAVSPFAHPIVPLLIDIESARESLPEAPLPQATVYPGGEARSRWHLQRGIEVFKSHFGTTPLGCWPSEGGVSEATVKLCAEMGFGWVATGESVLENSLRETGESPQNGDKQWLHRSYRYNGADTACFFRDDGLSDLIGFTYTNWHADDAVANLIHNLKNIAKTTAADPDAVVSIILDGENAWEYYPENGYYFLTALYAELAKHSQIELTTFSDALAAGVKPTPLQRLVAGSWVYGTFSTWIGEKDKNRGWDMLVDAKLAFDLAEAEGRITSANRDEVERQLAICEGSDWFWWFGDYNPSEAVSDFERLYRHHLANLYDLIDQPRPAYLDHAFTHGGGAPEMGGVMRTGKT